MSSAPPRVTGRAGPPTIPRLWPSSLTYLRSPRYCSSISPESLSSLRRPLDAGARGNTTNNMHSPCPLAQIGPIKSATHPACGQHGLFAARHLEPDSLILFYIGFVHGADQTDPRSDYDLSLDRDRGIGIDAAKMGNEARFINDYRGVSDGPNAEFRDCWVAITGEYVEKRIGIFVLSAGRMGKRAKGIAKGEEILVSYGKGFWASRNQHKSSKEVM